MKKYEIKTSFREVSYGECWISVKAESVDEALALAEKGEYELDDYISTDVESFEVGVYDDTSWIEGVSEV